MHAPAQFDVLQPVQDEQRALDAGVGEMTKSAPTVSLFRGSARGGWPPGVMNLRDCTHTLQLVSVRVIQSRALSIAASCATCSASSA